MIVTVENAKAHLNITTDDDDALIGDKIAAAEAWVAAFIGCDLADFDPAPEPLKEAVRMLAAHFYENREASIVGVSMQDVSPGVFDLLAPFRVWEF